MATIQTAGYIGVAALVLATVVLAVISGIRNRGRKRDRSDGSDPTSPDGWGSDSPSGSGSSGDS